MGSNWSWPCCERDKRGYRVQIARLPRLRLPIERPVAQIALVTTEELQKNLLFQQQVAAAYVTRNPLDHGQSIVFLQKPSKIRTFAYNAGKYSLHPGNIGWEEWGSIMNRYSSNRKGEVLINVYGDNFMSHHILSYTYESPTEISTEFTVIPLENRYNRAALSQALQEHPEKKFKMVVEVENRSLLVLETGNPGSLSRHIHQQALDCENFIPVLSQHYASYLERDYTFEGACTSPEHFYLIFSR